MSRTRADYERIFEDSYGIYADEAQSPEDVLLEFDQEDGDYLSSRPLHHSQRLERTPEGRVRIYLRVHITADFKMELLSRARSIVVFQPATLREELLTYWRTAIARHQEVPSEK